MAETIMAARKALRRSFPEPDLIFNVSRITAVLRAKYIMKCTNLSKFGNCEMLSSGGI